MSRSSLFMHILPDIQYDDKNGVHHNIEYETNPRNKECHKPTIERNDPNARNEFNVVEGDE